MLVLLALALAPAVAAAPVALRWDVRACPEAGADACRTPERRQMTWLVIRNPGALAALEPGWQLLVDQTRFRSLLVEAETPSGTQIVACSAHDLSRQWTLGNYLKIDMAIAGADVKALRIGFEGIDDPALLRSIRAMTPADHARHQLQWIGLIALVGGVLICSLAYNLLLLSWLSTQFQRWYVLWATCALAYLAIWSGGILYVFPGLAGAISARASYLLVGLLIVTGAGFFFSIIENDRIPPRLVKAGQIAAATVALTSWAAALDTLVPAHIGDRAVNIAFVATTALIATAVVAAIFRGSRAVWFYLAGWAPALLVFSLRVARNFGLGEQSDVIDKATFAAIGIEAIMLSLAIADRFRQLRHDYDAAEAERDTLRRVAMTDAMTGLANRTAFQARLESGPGPGGLDLVIVDIDFLKQANDTAGHETGDLLIAHVAGVLAEAAAGAGLVARIGGDEFIVLLEGADRQRLPAVLAAIDALAVAVISHSGVEVPCSASAGHAAVAAGSDEAIGLVHKRADIALYVAKAEGRGRWRSYHEDMGDVARLRGGLAAEAHAALTEGGFLLHLQPVFDMTSCAAVSHEALLRWQHPRLGLIGPDSFGELFADPTLASRLHVWVVDRALAELAAMRAAGRPDAVISINVHAGQLDGEAASAALLAALAAHDVPAEALIVELTDGVTPDREAAVALALAGLRAAGVRVALDDFGTGPATLAQLRALPSDMIKIDRALIAALPDDVASGRIVTAIVTLARSLGREVVAKGIESEAQRQYLRRLGCRWGQGYLFARPARPAMDAASAAA